MYACVFAERISIPRDHETHEGVGFAFVVYRNQVDANHAVSKIDKYRLGHQLLRYVDVTHSRAAECE